jgi:hypothetical protein
MKMTSPGSSHTASLAAVYAFGSPGGGVLIVVLWWLLALVADPATATDWWQHALVAAYILAPVWAPLLSGFATLRLAARLGWVDWGNA